MTHIGIILLSLWFSTTPKLEMAGLKQGQQNIYLQDRIYDEQGRKYTNRQEMAYGQDISMTQRVNG